MQTFWQEKLLLQRLYNDRDAEAFGQLYDRYAPKIYRYVYFKVATATEAEDLTAEVFLKTWEYVLRHGQEKDKRIQNFRAFIYQLARNLIVDHYRRKAERFLLVDEATLHNVPEAPERNPYAVAAVGSDIEIMNQALRGLKDDYRELIILRYIEELSTSEIATIVGKNSGAVRVSLHRAMSALREEMSKLQKPNVNS